MNFPLLSSIVFTPLVGALLILLVPKDREGLIKTLATATASVVFALSAYALYQFSPEATGYQFVEKFTWIPPIRASYYLGIDGISMPLIFLSGLLTLVCVVASYGIAERVKEYFVMFLLLATGMMGTFCALDLFLFYIFWEIVLVPMYFLIGIWGGPRREYAAIKFFLYTLAGSVLMLLSILAVYLAASPHTFSIPALVEQGVALGHQARWWIFLGFFIAFAIKVPVFPFHTWLPDAHVEAPTPISVILAGVLLKMGGYGFFRIAFPMLPEITKEFGIVFAVLGLINVVYGGFVALAQTDFKKLVAYSSVAHMGFVLLGFGAMTISGWNGALLEMFNHGIITGGMFLLVGALYDRAHTRDLEAFGGLGAKVPVYSGLLILFAMASLGLPGMAGFVSEFLAIMGAFGTYPVITGISVLGLVLGAAYFLIMLQKVLLGTLNPKWEGLSDINTRELVTLLPLIFFTLWVGLWPKTILGWQGPALTELLRSVGGNIGW